MHAGPVLALDDRPLAADGLDRIKEAVPDADAGQREGALELALHRDIHVLTYDKSNESRDQCRHGKDLPVCLEDEHAEVFPEVDRDLCEPPAVVRAKERE